MKKPSDATLSSLSNSVFSYQIPGLRKRELVVFLRLITGTGADWGSGKHSGLRTQGSLVQDLAGSPFVVALSKSHLPPAQYWLNPGSLGRTTDLDRL